MNIRPEDIVEGNGKLTLGLIWTIILNFQVSLIKDREQQKALARAAVKNNNASSNAVLFESTTSSTSYYQQQQTSGANGAPTTASSQSVVLQRQVNLQLIFNTFLNNFIPFFTKQDYLSFFGVCECMREKPDMFQSKGIHEVRGLISEILKVAGDCFHSNANLPFQNFKIEVHDSFLFILLPAFCFSVFCCKMRI